LYQQWGVNKSKLLFNHLAPNEHPNYQKGKEDNTHFNELGARMIAQIVLKNIKSLGLELSERIKK
jgi:lysophospholipase L1-like esterase